MSNFIGITKALEHGGACSGFVSRIAWLAFQRAGEMISQFVVDADGRYEPGSFKVLKSSHELFTQAVKNALPNMRFYPAEVGGKKVKQLVQQPFTFSLSKG